MLGIHLDFVLFNERGNPNSDDDDSKQVNKCKYAAMSFSFSIRAVVCSRNRLRRRSSLWHILVLPARVHAVPRNRRAVRTSERRQPFAYLGRFQFLVVLLRRVAHGFDGFIVHFKAEFNALMKCAHRFTCRVKVDHFSRLDEALFMVDARLDHPVANGLDENRRVSHERRRSDSLTLATMYSASSGESSCSF